MLASGLSLIFGLMSVLNFAHGGLFAWGAFTGVWLFNMTGSYILALVGAVAMGMFLGFILERFLIRPVYGNHVRQSLVTLGGMLVLSECIKIFWGQTHAHQLKNENKMNFRSNKLKTRNVLLVLKSTHTK